MLFRSDSKAALALMCSPAVPKYPSLYYLFPVESHNQRGLTEIIPQPVTEEYIAQNYISNALSTAGVNRGVTYRVVGNSSSIPLTGDLAGTGISTISFVPKAAPNGSNWALPTTIAGAGTLNPESMQIKLPNGSRAALSLLDKAMYNGREEMVVRVLDVDLEKLTRNKNGSGDYWISDALTTINGIFYAAREDAARDRKSTRLNSSHPV